MHASARMHTHTCTNVCMAYSGRHACQQRWRALSWLLLNQPFPPQKGARLGEGEGKSWLSEHQTASIEQSQQAGGDWNRVKRNVSKRSLPYVNPTKTTKVGFPGNAVCRCPASPLGQLITFAAHINDVTVHLSYCRNIFEAVRQSIEGMVIGSRSASVVVLLVMGWL